MNIKVVGIDLAKSVFQVCVWQQDGSITWNRKVTRSKLFHTIRQFPDKALIALVACGFAHHWARQFITLGHQVVLIPEQHIKPLADYQKMMLLLSMIADFLSGVIFLVKISYLKQQLPVCLEDADNCLSFVLLRLQ
ncbi:hypothetical protein [Vibrio sp. STUT-A16]|uniref:hypothetical protein n=1 Tax=Vibrio sp. STUT-A16 TaxID=2976237 RepID=UPI0022304BBB|nr:hypothetical protein [Vibrio sp. STUT-A16]